LTMVMTIVKPLPVFKFGIALRSTAAERP